MTELNKAQTQVAQGLDAYTIMMHGIAANLKANDIIVDYVAPLSMVEGAANVFAGVANFLEGRLGYPERSELLMRVRECIDSYVDSYVQKGAANHVTDVWRGSVKKATDAILDKLKG